MVWPDSFEDYMDSICGTSALYGIEITKPLRNAASVTSAERKAFADAVVALTSGTAYRLDTNNDGLIDLSDTDFWHLQAAQHGYAANGPARSYTHGKLSNTTWHREFVGRYEQMLRKYNPTLTILYWDWTTNPSSMTEFGGWTNGIGVSVGAPWNALEPGWGTRAVIDRVIDRDIDPAAAGPVAAMLPSSTFTNYAALCSYCASNHGNAHRYFGTNSSVEDPIYSPEDPAFFMLHGYLDLYWAGWQRADPTRFDPATAYDTSAGNTELTSTMGPWDGTSNDYDDDGDRVPDAHYVEPWDTEYIVTKDASHHSVVAPPVYDNVPLVVPVLQPGESCVLEIPWYPPDPANYSCLGFKGNATCFLVHIHTDPTAADLGMTTALGSSVRTNVKENNNVALRNSLFAFLSRIPLVLAAEAFLVRGVYGPPAPAAPPPPTALRIDVAGLNAGQSLRAYGTVEAVLTPNLYQLWQQGGSQGIGVQDAGPNRVRLTAEVGELRGLLLPLGASGGVSLELAVNAGYQPPATVLQASVEQRGTPQAATESVGGEVIAFVLTRVTLIPPRSRWKYLRNQAPPANWAAENYDDTAWPEVEAELGTDPDARGRIKPAPGAEALYVRRTFTAPDPARVTGLFSRLKSSDGAVLYLNGAEVHRFGLPSGPLTPQTPALTPRTGLAKETYFPVSLNAFHQHLRPGRNVLAAEIHRSAGGGSLSFDLVLEANPADTLLPPSLAIGFPPRGSQQLAGQQLTVSLSALDPQGQPLGPVRIEDNGQLLATLPPGTLSWTWPQPPLGIRRLTAWVGNQGGLQSMASSTFTAVTTLPPAVILGPLQHHIRRCRPGIHGHTAEECSVTFTAMVLPQPGTWVPQRVEFYYHRMDRFVPPMNLGGDIAAPYALTFPSTALPAGHGMVSVRAYAPDGRQTESLWQMLEIEEEDLEVVLLHTRVPGAVRLEWTVPGAVLQKATTPAGPWISVPAATSPYAAPMDAVRSFYRLLLP